MDIIDLKYFISAATLGSFSAAAVENHISQSSFSKRIMSLESELGVELFSRKRRSIALTEAGTCLFDHAYAILNDYNKLKADMERYISGTTDVISIATIPVMQQYHLTNVISEFHTTHPHISFNLFEGESEQVLTSLKKMDCNFAILRTDFLDATQFNINPLVEDRLAAILPATHPLAKRDRVSIAELKGERFILPTSQSDLYTICVNACAKADFRPNVLYSVSGKTEITLEFVRKSDAITLAMEQVVSHYDTDGCVIVPLEESITSTTALVWPRRATLSPACRVFLNYLSVNVASPPN